MGIQLVIYLLACSPLVLSQDEKQADEAVPIEASVTTADALQSKRLLKDHAFNNKSGDSQALVAVLRKMSAFDNDEFIAAGKLGLGYRASKADKVEAKLEAEELGLRAKKEIEALVIERVSAVQAASAHLLGNFPGNKKVTSALARTFKDKEFRRHRPLACAAVISSMGKLGYRKAEPDIFSLCKRQPQPDVARSCVRYFGLIKTRDKSVVRYLCEELSAPEPASVHAASNPPAAYWEARWKTWNAIRRDVSWSLKQITGQVFRPTEGKHPSDKKKALEYVKRHAKELGLK